MLHRTFLLFTATALLACASAQSQDSDADELKIAALEALIAAPPERALPAVTRVLQSDNSIEVKESALFILSQIDTPEARNLLLQTARQEDGELQEEAIQMIGVSGDPAALASLREVYSVGDVDVRESVLEAFLIADETSSVLEIALEAETEEELDAALEMLAAMDATEELRQVRAQVGVSESLIEAYAVSGDFDSLRELAADNSNPEQQVSAIEAMGIVGGDKANAALVEIYRATNDEDVREAALDGMLISGYDQGVLDLYRASNSTDEKRELLEYLSIMGSDEIWDVIDAALEGNR